MSLTDEGAGEGRRVSGEVLYTVHVGCRDGFVARKMGWGVKRVSGYVGFMGEGNSSPEVSFDHANVQNRGRMKS